MIKHEGYSVNKRKRVNLREDEWMRLVTTWLEFLKVTGSESTENLKTEFIVQYFHLFLPHKEDIIDYRSLNRRIKRMKEVGTFETLEKKEGAIIVSSTITAIPTGYRMYSACRHLAEESLLNSTRGKQQLLRKEYRDDTQWCPRCRTEEGQIRRLLYSNCSVLDNIHAMKYSGNVHFNDTTKHTFIVRLPKKMQIPNEFKKAKSYKDLIGSTFTVLKKIIERPKQLTDTQAKNQQELMKGGKIPVPSSTWSLNKQQQLDNPNGIDMLIASWNTPCGNVDYLCKTRLGLHTKDIVGMAMLGGEIAAGRPIDRRRGHAPGIVKVPLTEQHDPLSFNKGTKQLDDRQFQSLPSGTLQMIYKSKKTGKPARYEDVAGDFIGKVLEPGSLKKENPYRILIANNSSLRKKIIAEGKSRIKAMLCIEDFHLDDVAEKWEDLEYAIALVKEVTGLYEYWREIDNTLDRFEMALLEVMCDATSTWNFQACGAHKDGRNSTFESLSVHGRCANNNTASMDDLFKSIINGKLIFPLEGFYIDMICSDTVLHCKLRGTIHIADYSRNNDNYSNAEDHESRRRRRRQQEQQLRQAQNAANALI